MRRRFRRAGGPGNAAIAAVTVPALCAGAWLLREGAVPHAPPQPSAAQAHTGDDDRSAGGSSAPALPPSPPLRVRIPAIDVAAPLTGLGLTATGSLDVPPADRENLAGWYE